MHRDHHVGIELPDLGDDLLEVVCRRRPEMEAADDRVHLLYAGHLLRLPHRIDDADVTAGADHDEPLAADVEAGRVLVHVLVGHDLSLQLRRRVMAGVAAEPVLDRVVDEAVRQDTLDAAPLDLSGGEGVAGITVGVSHRTVVTLLRIEVAPVERADFGELPGLRSG